MLLEHALYISQAKGRLSEMALWRIVEVSRKNNPREGLTGFLHYESERFLQYLEGPPAPLARKLSQIRKDRRHSGFQILSQGKIEERLFPLWDMGQISHKLLENSNLRVRKGLFAGKAEIDHLSILSEFAEYADRLHYAGSHQH